MNVQCGHFIITICMMDLIIRKGHVTYICFPYAWIWTILQALIKDFRILDSSQMSEMHYHNREVIILPKILHSTWHSVSLPSGRAIHAPQISTSIYGRISGDHPRGNFIIISLRKFRRNKGEFCMWVFPHFFPERINEDISTRKFSSYIPQNVKV